MKISYAITVCNEFEVHKLIDFIFERKRKEDEICVLLDSPKAPEGLLSSLKLKEYRKIILLQEATFDDHFADWKNKLTKICSGDYIFQIDADELPSEDLIKYLPSILEGNPDCDVYAVPRINIVHGITQEHISKWRWNVNDRGYINFPDFQWRIYKNKEEVFWINRVHEVLYGYKTYAHLPAIDQYCLSHIKEIRRQEAQNDFYAKL